MTFSVEQGEYLCEALLQNEGEMRTFRAVTVVVAALVVYFGHGHVEHPFGPVDLGRDFRQIGDLQRGAVLLNDVHQRNIVEIQFIVHYRELVLRKFESLFDQIDVLVFHAACRVFVHPARLLR